MIKRRITCCKCGRRETALVSETIQRGQAMCWECRRKAQAEEERRRAASYREMTTRVWWD